MQSINNPLAQRTDFELITCFQASHDVRAYAELYNRYYPKVELYCLKSIKDKQDAQDAVQDVFLKVFEKLSTLEQPQLWVAWLFRITRNLVLNIHKKNAQRSIKNMDDLLPIPDDTSGLEALMEKERMFAALPELLETPGARILKMKYVEGHTIEQICHDMHLKESAVKMRLLRARHHIVNLYQQHYGHRA